MSDELPTREQTVVACPACDYRRTFAEPSRRVGGAVRGHMRSADCDGTPTVGIECLLVCESCGYDASDGATVEATDGRYPEATLCEVCRDHRDERRVETGVAWLVDA
jgi:hypothetical protein